MFRRTVRIACLALGLLATAGLTYRAIQNEEALASHRQSAAANDAAVHDALTLLLDARASLHAYVAPGQGLPFWGKRAQETIDALRQKLVTLDSAVAPSGASLSESLDGVDQLTAAERRARTYVSRGELQLAGDVIFTEVRDILAAATAEVQDLRVNLKRTDERQGAAVRAEQTMLAAGALGVWIAIALFLLPTEKRAAVQDPAEWRNSLKETLKKPTPVAAEVPPPPVLVETPVVPKAPEPQPLSLLAPEALHALRATSEICADLSAMADPGALEGALARVSGVLNATGLIVWIAGNDGSSLSPVATHGFDPKLVQRIGRIPRDSGNMTAAAFRENAPKVSAATATAPGALAVPMGSPTGPAGVLSVELKPGQTVDEARVALAAIMAAQLATLALPIADPQPVVESTRAAG